MIELYVRDIRRALECECWFAALSLSLALPDICGMVEFADRTVSERYIGWYDKYLGAQMRPSKEDQFNPYLSGEIVYNLRNTFLHQGTPMVDSGKVRENRNKLDRFGLVLGDGSLMHSMSLAVSLSDASVRMMMVDISYLCRSLCDCALLYWQNNREKFDFAYNIIPQDALIGKSRMLENAGVDEDPLGEMLLEKLDKAGKPLHFQGNLTKTLAGALSQGQPELQTARRQSAAVLRKPATASTGKREHQLRCFFGQHFRERKYAEKREDIVQAVLSSNTKTGLNNRLMKLFPGEDVKIILTRLNPLIRDWPGR